MGDQRVEIGGQRLTIRGIVDRDMAHPVAGGLELAREIAHRREDGDHLLGVVHDIVGLLAHFQQQVDDIGPGLAVPGMLRVELVAQDKAQRRAIGRTRGSGGWADGWGSLGFQALWPAPEPTIGAVGVMVLRLLVGVEAAPAARVGAAPAM